MFNYTRNIGGKNQNISLYITWYMWKNT